MKRTRNNTICQFVDLEARVADGDEEEEDEDDMGPDEFIDDRSIVYNSEDDDHRRHVSWRQFSDGSDEDVVLARLLERYDQEKASIVAGGNSRHERPPVATGSIESGLDKIARSPTYHDYPLWRVSCKLGLEEEVVYFLLEIVASRHEVRSAFTRGSIRGWVYLEATMNEVLRRLLKITPGVIRVQSDIICQQIEFGDWLKMLRMRAISGAPEVGKWVEVSKGNYRGDVGYVQTIENWGVNLLLVPRLPPPQLTYTSHSKRKRSLLRPSPTLFDPFVIKQVYDVEPTYIDEDIYSFRGNKFEHGLIIKSYDIHSISTTIIGMPTDVFYLFRNSLHPNVVTSAFPRPLEWIFNVNEEVLICSSKKKGVVTKVGTDFVEVDLVTGEGDVSVSWSDIRKVVVPGDYVEITSGSLQGQTGWVEGMIQSEVAGVVQHNVTDEGDHQKPFSIKALEVHVNWLKRIDVPFSHGKQLSQPNDTNSLQFDQVPWIKTVVVITKHGHPMKGYQGIIKTVLCRQTTCSGLKVVIEFTHLDSSAPFKTITLDYDDVVEASLGRKLFDFAKPKSNLFKPRNHTASPSQFLPVSLQQPFQSLTHDETTTGYATPMADLPLSSTPAWDPSSRTPMPDFQTPVASPSRLSAPQEPDEAQHVLLDRRLLNVQLKVLVTGGKFNKEEMVVSIVSVEGQIIIQHMVYNRLAALQPEWVTPKHPNPTRNNGLLIVIKGEHCGKYVRRIHHRYEGEMAVVILAVVNRAAGAVDNLTGEQLDLDVSYLCLCPESKDDKTLNRSLMVSLREEGRKTRAK